MRRPRKRTGRLRTPEEVRQHLRGLGLGVDWRAGSLNPPAYGAKMIGIRSKPLIFIAGSFFATSARNHVSRSRYETTRSSERRANSSSFQKKLPTMGGIVLSEGSPR